MLRTHQQAILDSIRIPSNNNPYRPEFPSDNPRFPATPTYKIQVPGFSNVRCKDESYNPTGTHKDRLAREIVVTYRSLLLHLKEQKDYKELPSFSLISSGSAAFAIQMQLRHYGLPALKVLLDPTHVPEHIINALSQIGCLISKTDLSAKLLSGKEVLALTDNLDGFDITSNAALDPSNIFYDRLSYEIINSRPEYCFVPFGTGNLYENILNAVKKEVLAIDSHDPRFDGEVESLRKAHFLWATTNNPESKAFKLYAPSLPFVNFNDQWIRVYTMAGFCGEQSNVYILEEEFLEQAIAIAAENNIATEYSGIAWLALLLQQRDHVPSDAKILIVNTGKVKYELAYSSMTV